jgi:hypothetical protein
MKGEAPNQTDENRSIYYLVLHEFRDTLSLLALLFAAVQIDAALCYMSKYAVYYNAIIL